MQPTQSMRLLSTKLFRIALAFSMVQMTTWHLLAAEILWSP